MPGLDGVRGIAVLLVLGCHCSIPFMVGGGIGVDIFFVLSGFLISRILLAEYNKHGKIDFSAFYWRRFLRIFPPLLFVCAGICIVAPFVGIPWSALQRDFSVTLTFISDYTRAKGGIPLYLAPTWSLAVEEQFYLLWPISALALMSMIRSPRRIISIVVMGIVVIAAWRVYRFNTTSNLIAVFDSFDSRADALLWGCALAFVDADRMRRIAQLWPAAVVILAGFVVLSEWSQSWLYFGGLTLASVSSAILIAAAVSRNSMALSAALESGAMRWLGRISYSVYLCHWPPLIMLYIAGYRGIALLPVVPLGIALGAFSYYFVERPALRLKTVDAPWIKRLTILLVPTLLAIGVFYVLPGVAP